MSSYQTCEAALLTLVRAYSAGSVFTASNSSRDDWTIIDTAATSAVIEMANDTQEGWDTGGYGTQGSYQEVHSIDLWLCVKRSAGATGDGTLKQTLKTLTGAVLDYLRPYERLNGAAGVAHVQYQSTTTPNYISPTRSVSDASHLAQRIRASVHCEASYTPLEEGY